MRPLRNLDAQPQTIRVSPAARGKCPKDKGGAKGLRRPLPLWMDVPSAEAPAFAGMT